MDAKTPAPPPEANLIKEALRRQKLSSREASRRAGVSDTWWRNVMRGYQTVGGVIAPVKGQPDTLARMAQVTGVTPTQLRDAGRADAAEALEQLITEAAEDAAAERAAAEEQLTADTASSRQSTYANDPHISAIAALLATLPPEAQEEVLRRVNRGAGMTRHQETPGQERRAG